MYNEGSDFSHTRHGSNNCHINTKYCCILFHSFLVVFRYSLDMDFGEAKFIRSKNLNHQLLIVNSERNAGMCFLFHKKTDVKYACASCKKLGKTRTVSVKDGRLIGKCLCSLSVYFSMHVILTIHVMQTVYK